MFGIIATMYLALSSQQIFQLASPESLLLRLQTLPHDDITTLALLQQTVALSLSLSHDMSQKAAVQGLLETYGFILGYLQQNGHAPDLPDLNQLWADLQVIYGAS